MQVQCIAAVGCVLGEGPVWDWREGRLYWVDIKAPGVHAWDARTGRLTRWPMPQPIGAVGLRERGGLVGAFRDGFGFIDLASGAVTPIVDPEADQPGNRFNDGKVDPPGRFWAGTMDDGEQQPSGHLYRLDADLAVERFPAGFVVTNGIDWSRDGRTLYFVDSAERAIYACAFDMAAGRPGDRRLFARVRPQHGFPDGLAVDADDHVWSAHWDGGRVTRYRPDGSVEQVIEMPVPRCTSCCFGGDGLDTLFVTSAAIGLAVPPPQSGDVFAVTGLAVKGRRAGLFRG